MRVLGIDPSSRATGYGVIESEGGTAAVLGFGSIRPPRTDALPDRLLRIRTDLAGLIRRFEPAEVAVENPFLSRNIKTALTLGQVRGAVLIAVAESGKPLFEYSPLEIKKAVTGYGQAEKVQVAAMVRTLLGLREEAPDEDASDALACALCHLHTRLFQLNLERSSR